MIHNRQFYNYLFVPLNIFLSSLFFVMQYKFWNKYLAADIISSIILTQSYTSMIQLAAAGLNFYLFQTVKSQKDIDILNKSMANLIIISIPVGIIVFLFNINHNLVVVMLYTIYFEAVALNILIGSFLDKISQSYSRNMLQSLMWLLSLLTLGIMWEYSFWPTYLPICILIGGQLIILVYSIRLSRVSNFKLGFSLLLFREGMGYFYPSLLAILLDPINKYFISINAPQLIISFEFTNKLLQQLNGMIVNLIQSVYRSNLLKNGIYRFALIGSVFGLAYCVLPIISKFSGIQLSYLGIYLEILFIVWLVNSVSAYDYVFMIINGKKREILIISLILIFTLVAINKLAGNPLLSWSLALSANSLIYIIYGRFIDRIGK